MIAERLRRSPVASSFANFNQFPGGTMHKEIFTFKRVSNGPLKGHEWDRVVQPVIERWGRFVEEMI